VLPLVSKLHDADGGRCYLRIAAELVNRTTREIEPGEPSILTDPLGRDPHDSITRWSRLVGPLLPPIVVGPPAAPPFAAMRFAHIELAAGPASARTRPTGCSPATSSTSSVDPRHAVSEETAALLEQRAARNRTRRARA
jgi:hypothetical protein